MKIISIEIENKFLELKIEKILFTSSPTLLVGLSGVGKTQILRAIDDLQDISNGRAINGFKWKIEFSTTSCKKFIWEGEFSVNKDTEKVYYDLKNEEDNQVKPTILFEKLYSQDKVDQIIVDRNEDRILFNNNEMPKLSSTESILYILKEEKSIQEIVECFQKIILKDHTRRENNFFALTHKNINSLKNEYDTLDKIKNSKENIRTKLFLAYELQLDVITKIEDRFISTFPLVESVKINISQDDFLPNKYMITSIFIKEKEVPNWIKESRISSGMLRTFIHISELFLSSNGSVILIDEFENSLGINCLEILTEDLLEEGQNLQFIATSHHPYIINNIPPEYWKIVTRKGGVIKTHDASEYKIGSSKHDAFIQLINKLS